MGKFIVVLGILLQVYSAHAVELFFFDYDGTIVQPKKFNKKTPGIYDTKVRLFKIRHRPNSLVPIPEGPDVIEVSASDLRHKLTRVNEITDKEEFIISPGDGRIGSLEKVTLEDGTQIVPGYYHIISPDSFIYYRDFDGQNYLLQDFKRAEELEEKGLGTFKGRYWSVMVNMLSNEKSAQQFGIITARGHSREQWDELFTYMIQKGYIKYKPNIKNIHSVSRPEYQKYGMKIDDIASRKVDLLKSIILSVSKAPAVNTDYRLHPNGNKAGNYHVVGFVDDNQETLALAVKTLRAEATTRIPVKIIISNSGEDYEVKKSKRPRHLVIGKNGVFRSATDFEAFGEPNHQNDKKFVGAKLESDNLPQECVALF